MKAEIKNNLVCLSLKPGSDEYLVHEGIEFKRINGRQSVIKGSSLIIEDISAAYSASGEVILRIESCYEAAYGLGERFDRVNQKGFRRETHILEKFCNQGEKSYCPVPFFFTDSGFGIYVDTLVVTEFSFSDAVEITIHPDSNRDYPDIYFFFGLPKDIISRFSKLTGKVGIPPKWAFGVWISANRWNNQAEIEKQSALCKKYGFPVNVIVIEAWSDEETFYIWNGAEYRANSGGDGFCPDDFHFDKNGLWPDPKNMIDALKAEGIRLVLWQIPVLKWLGDGNFNIQHDTDCEYAIREKFCAMKEDSTPYRIPDGHWFSHSMIPDFTNPKACGWWLGKRKYLLEMGVAGFKTDGGEFVYEDDALFHSGLTGKEMKNGFAQSYVRAYTEFTGAGCVLFSRAGYSGQHSCPIQWAGDQTSTWEEFRHVITAGISAGLSGIPFWSFDIGGFAGPLPDTDLYERSTHAAVFAPVMQWHSEPSGGQFTEFMPSAMGVNDRSPWNIASVFKDEGLIERLRFHYHLRTNLIPYIYNESIKSSQTGLPVMCHLFVEYPGDPQTRDIDDEFMLGGMLVAPILERGACEREVYLPEGFWTDLFSGDEYPGGRKINVVTGLDRIPVFIRNGSAVALNLGDDLKLGSVVGNCMIEYKNLCFYLSGSSGSYHFQDDLENEIIIRWQDEETHTEVLSGNTVFKTIRKLSV